MLDEVDHCAIQDGEACANGGSCIDLFGEYECECAQGYGGITCEHHDTVNDCESGEECNNHGSCTDTFFGFECTCEEGWGGTECTTLETTNTDPCVSSPCMNGGVCADEWFGNEYSYACTCSDTTNGLHCEHEDTDDQCATVPWCVRFGRRPLPIMVFVPNNALR